MKFRITLLFLVVTVTGSAQYFVDIFSFNRQSFNVPNGAQTNNLFVNAFIPKVLENGNTFFVRAHYEKLDLKNDSLSASYSSVTLPVGMQVQLKNLKWKFTGLIIPKIAGADLGAAFSNVFQIGVYSLFTVTESEKFRYKFGLYYNREFFGNFFVPLVGIDWKVSGRFSVYGTLPQSFKASYALVPSRVNAGLAFRSMVRTFRGEDNNTFVRYNELQFKTFFDVYLTPKNVVFIEGGYFLGKTPLLYNNDDTENPVVSNLFKEGKIFPLINAGWALRF